MAKVKKNTTKKPRGENWESIHENLRMLARRIVSAQGGLDDIQDVYKAMRVAKKYEEMASPGYVAKKLEEQGYATLRED